MSEGWRTTQVFLSNKTFAFYEVEMQRRTGNLRCTCNGFKTRLKCRHVAHVKDAMDKNGGSYPQKIDARVKDHDFNSLSRDEYRRVVLENAEVKVL